MKEPVYKRTDNQVEVLLNILGLCTVYGNLILKDKLDKEDLKSVAKFLMADVPTTGMLVLADLLGENIEQTTTYLQEFIQEKMGGKSVSLHVVNNTNEIDDIIKS